MSKFNEYKPGDKNPFTLGVTYIISDDAKGNFTHIGTAILKDRYETVLFTKDRAYESCDVLRGSFFWREAPAKKQFDAVDLPIDFDGAPITVSRGQITASCGETLSKAKTEKFFLALGAALGYEFS